MYLGVDVMVAKEGCCVQDYETYFDLYGLDKIFNPNKIYEDSY